MTLTLDLANLTPAELQSLEVEATALRDALLELRRPDVAQLGSVILTAVHGFPEPVAVDVNVPADPDAFEAMMSDTMRIALENRDDRARSDAVRDVWADVLIYLDDVREAGRELQRIPPAPGGGLDVQ